MDRSKMFGEEKVGKLLWKFSLPAIVGMVVNALYGVVDRAFVGNGVSEKALTAVGIDLPLMIIVMAFAMLIGVGATALISIRLGENKKEEAENILGNTFSLIIIAAIVLTGIFLYYLNPILVSLGATPDLLPFATDYMKIILAGSVFQYVGFGLNNIIRADGSPKTAMATMLIGAVINAILNALFIFGFKWGIKGSALSTIIAQSISAIWVITYFTNRNSHLKLHKSNFKLKKDIVLGIFSIGMSPFLMQIAASVITLLFNRSLLVYGENEVAAMTSIGSIAMLILMPIFGINQGAQPIIGFNYGAQNYHRVKETLKKAVIGATIVSTTGFIAVQLFSSQIMRLFTNNPELIKIGANGIKIYLFMIPIVGFQIVSANYFQAVGKPLYAILLSMSRQVILLIPLVLILPSIFGLNGVWLSGPISDFGASVVTGICLLLEVRKLKDMHNETLLQNR